MKTIKIGGFTYPSEELYECPGCGVGQYLNQLYIIETRFGDCLGECIHCGGAWSIDGDWVRDDE